MSIEHWEGSLSTELKELMESEAIKLSSCFSFAYACVMLITFVFHLFTLITELKIHHHFNQYFIYHLPRLLPTLLLLAVYRKRVIQEVMDLIPVENSDFFFVLLSCHVDYFIFITFIIKLNINSPSFISLIRRVNSGG